MTRVFLLDVDNTLIDNDRAKGDLDLEIRTLVSPYHAGAFWSVYEEVRQECGGVDFPDTLRRFRRAFPDDARAGLSRAAKGNVFVYAHKEDHLAEVQIRFPADHYVHVDDKASLLARTKERLDGRVTTIHVRQGHYASDPPAGPKGWPCRRRE